MVVRTSETSIYFNERLGRVVNTPGSYSGGSGFKSGPGDRLSWLRILWFSSVPSGECRDSSLQLGHYRFLPNSDSYFHCDSTIQRYVVLDAEKQLLNKLQKIDYFKMLSFLMFCCLLHLPSIQRLLIRVTEKRR
jgi:hypothetical protein